jgi:hypothetical protein
MADSDCLSNLPDDLLRRILHFLPAKEGASTSALARRWRMIWPSIGVIVNLHSRSYDHLESRYQRRDMIIRDAHEALDGAHTRGSPVTKFTFWYEEGQDDPSNCWYSGSYYDDVHFAQGDMSRELQKLLDSPAACDIQELRVGLFFGPRNNEHLYDLSIGRLACSEALRVLHVSKFLEWDLPFRQRTPPPFPQLVELRLQQCNVSLRIIQAVIDAAPNLAVLHLDGVAPILSDRKFPPVPRSLHLRCPKINYMVLANMYCWGYQSQNTLEVDAPLLRCLTYEGPIRSLSLKPLPPDMARVDFRFHVPAQVHTEDGTCRLFWEIVRNFSSIDTINLNFQLSEYAYQGDHCY